PSNAGPLMLLTNPLNLNRTSAVAVGFRASLPLKITSSLRSPRRLLALCSPITHVMASATLLLPQPFGPTIAVTPRSKASSARSENELKPAISIRSKRISWLLMKIAMPSHCGKGHRTPQDFGLGAQRRGRGVIAPRAWRAASVTCALLARRASLRLRAAESHQRFRLGEQRHRKLQLRVGLRE